MIAPLQVSEEWSKFPEDLLRQMKNIKVKKTLISEKLTLTKIIQEVKRWDLGE